MLWVMLVVIGSFFSQSYKFVIGVKVDAMCGSKLDDSQAVTVTLTKSYEEA